MMTWHIERATGHCDCLSLRSGSPPTPSRPTRDYERRLPRVIAVMWMLLTSVALWAIIYLVAETLVAALR